MKLPNLQRSLSLVLVLSHAVAANTEIITFEPSQRPAHLVHLPGNSSSLRPSDNARHWTLGAEPLWVLLDLDAPHTFTLRASWPASVPADIALALYGVYGHERARVARVVAVPRAPVAVPVVLVLERASFGVPASLVSTLAFLVPVLLAAAWLVPQVTAFLEPYAHRARADLKTGVTKHI